MNLFYFGARYYDPVVGVWTSTDPVRQTWNSYSYCGENPVGRTDPDGRKFRISKKWKKFWRIAYAAVANPADYVLSSLQHVINDGKSVSEGWDVTLDSWWNDGNEHGVKVSTDVGGDGVSPPVPSVSTPGGWTDPGDFSYPDDDGEDDGNSTEDKNKDNPDNAENNYTTGGAADGQAAAGNVCLNLDLVPPSSSLQGPIGSYGINTDMGVNRQFLYLEGTNWDYHWDYSWNGPSFSPGYLSDTRLIAFSETWYGWESTYSVRGLSTRGFSSPISAGAPGPNGGLFYVNVTKKANQQMAGQTQYGVGFKYQYEISPRKATQPIVDPIQEFGEEFIKALGNVKPLPGPGGFPGPIPIFP